MAREPDEKLQEAFSQFHEKMFDTEQKIQLVEMQIEKLKEAKAIGDLTVALINSYPKNTKTYESVGRMFFLDDPENILTGIHKRSKITQKKIASLEVEQQYMKQNLKKFEKNIAEIIKPKQGKGAPGYLSVL
ncbi:prefoldin subunit 1 [Nomia melanderi]|uniref:prefoldin subunit 1 n=1 Tax=Nomia melanderi TaxID=2448451 RepID=UPI001303FE09|nr:prefoldin subunit 1 [Nomia melanderi]